MPEREVAERQPERFEVRGSLIRSPAPMISANPSGEMFADMDFFAEVRLVFVGLFT